MADVSSISAEQFVRQAQQRAAEEAERAAAESRAAMERINAQLAEQAAAEEAARLAAQAEQQAEEARKAEALRKQQEEAEREAQREKYEASLARGETPPEPEAPVGEAPVPEPFEAPDIAREFGGVRTEDYAVNMDNYRMPEQQPQADAQPAAPDVPEEQKPPEAPVLPEYTVDPAAYRQPDVPEQQRAVEAEPPKEPEFSPGLGISRGPKSLYGPNTEPEKPDLSAVSGGKTLGGKSLTSAPEPPEQQMAVDGKSLDPKAPDAPDLQFGQDGQEKLGPDGKPLEVPEWKQQMDKILEEEAERQEQKQQGDLAIKAARNFAIRAERQADREVYMATSLQKDDIASDMAHGDIVSGMFKGLHLTDTMGLDWRRGQVVDAARKYEREVRDYYSGDKDGAEGDKVMDESLNPTLAKRPEALKDEAPKAEDLAMPEPPPVPETDPRVLEALGRVDSVRTPDQQAAYEAEAAKYQQLPDYENKYEQGLQYGGY